MKTEVERRVAEAQDLRQRARELDAFKMGAEMRATITKRREPAWWMGPWGWANEEEEIPRSVIREFARWAEGRSVELNAEADRILASVEVRDEPAQD